MAPAPSSTPSPCGMICEWRLGRCVFRCSAAWVSPSTWPARPRRRARRLGPRRPSDAAVNVPQQGHKHQTQVHASTPHPRPTRRVGWALAGFPANKKENRGSPALCVSGNFQGKQRVFGAPFWKLAVFPESESWSGAKSEAKLRKSTKYPGGRRVNSMCTRVLRKIPGILPIWPKIWLILGNHPARWVRF